MPKGKKTCPECGVDSGVRTSTCGCVHRFSSKQSSNDDTKKKTAEEQVVQKSASNEVERPVVSPKLFSSISCPLIQTPAGRCPIKPQGFSSDDWPNGPASDEVVESWALKVFSSGNYLPDAVVYWIHEFWDMNLNHGSEYKRIKELTIKTLCGNQPTV